MEGDLKLHNRNGNFNMGLPARILTAASTGGWLLGFLRSNHSVGYDKR